jgi:hypothetical protein
MNSKIMAIVAIAAVAALLATTAAVSTNSAFAGGHGHHYKKTQTTAQANACGNGPWPLKIFCQTLNSQIQGDGNAVNVIGVQPS